MREIIDQLDKSISCCLTGKAFGLCRQLIDDKGEVYPATYADRLNKFEKVTPDDRFKIMWFHRLENSSLSDSESYSFGRTFTKMNGTTIRTILLSEFSKQEDALNSMLEAMIGFMSPATTAKQLFPDYRFIEFGDSINVSRDRTAIWNAEFGNAYRDKYQMRYNIYAIEYTIDYIKCHECVSATT